MAEMTKELIVASCKANGGYAAPHLNDQLFLHCKGFTTIQNLEPYTDVKVLWLEQNAITELRGLEGMKALVSLFLQNNFLRSLTSCAAQLPNLRVLNISYNYLTSLDGLAAACPSLETLQASHNRISSLDACRELWQLADSLTSVDLSFNQMESVDAVGTSGEAAAPLLRLETKELEKGSSSTPPQRQHRQRSSSSTSNEDDSGDTDGFAVNADEFRVVEAAAAAKVEVVDPSVVPPCPNRADSLSVVSFFKMLPNVSVIYFHGNPLSHGLRQYRRNMILHLPALTYLDERPVFPEERRVIEAWGRGGEKAEAAERAAIREEKRAHLNSCVSVLTQRMESNREVRDRLTAQWDQQRTRELEALEARRRSERKVREQVDREETRLRTDVERMEQDAWWEIDDAARESYAALSKEEVAHCHAYHQRMATAQAISEAVEECAMAGAETSPAAATKILDEAASVTTSEGWLTRRASESAPSVEHLLSPSANGGGELHSTSTLVNTAAWEELMRSDDEILHDMELEIQQVLYDIQPGVGGRRQSQGEAPTPVHANVSAADTAVFYAAAECSSEIPRTVRVSDMRTIKMQRAIHSAVGDVARRLKAERRLSAEKEASQREYVWKDFEKWERRGLSQNSK